MWSQLEQNGGPSTREGGQGGERCAGVLGETLVDTLGSRCATQLRTASMYPLLLPNLSEQVKTKLTTATEVALATSENASDLRAVLADVNDNLGNSGKPSCAASIDGLLNALNTRRCCARPEERPIQLVCPLAVGLSKLGFLEHRFYDYEHKRPMAR